MPTSVVIAAAASTAGSYIAGSALAYSAIASTSWITFAGIEAAATFAVGSMLSNAVAPKQSQPQQAVAQQQQRMQVLRSPVAVRQIIYGEVMTSGALVHAVAANTSGADYIWLVIACAGHEVESIGTFYLNDEPVGALDGSGIPTGGKFAGYAKFNAHLGATDQAADADLMAFDANWTANHRLRGIAYIAVRLKYDQSVFPTGLPNIRFVVQGKKLYDPRTALTAYSNNAALVAYDYLTSYYGASAAEIVAASFIAAANICDEAVAKSSGGTESRYTANGQILMDVPRRQAMQTINSACGGLLTCPEGKFRYGVAAYTAPVVAFDEDILRAPIKVRAAVSRRDLYNAVKGQFINPDAYWQAADFPALTNSTYATQDGEQIFTDLQLPMTTSTRTAQRLAKIMLEKSRQGITVEMPCKLGAIVPVPNDNVSLTISHLGWSAKVFKVMKATLAQDGGVDLVLQEEASGCYDWSAEETTYDLAPDTNLPNPFTCGAPGALTITEELYETRGSAGVKAKAVMSWTAPSDGFIVDYQPEYKLAADSTWTVAPSVRGTAFEVLDVAPGSYDFRVLARNILGVLSDYSTVRSEIYGLLARPQDLTNLTLQAVSSLAILKFDRSSDLDVRIGGKIIVRHSPAQSGATWEGSVLLSELPGADSVAVLPLVAGTYLIKAEDSSGLQSLSAASVASDGSSPFTWTTLGTVQEDPVFGGTHSNTYVDRDVGDLLELMGTGSFDDYGDFDSSGSSFDYTGGVTPSGSYVFAAGIDLGSAQKVRLTATLSAIIENVLLLFDEETGLFDDVVADFDHTAGADADAWVEVRTTNDDPAGTPTWGAWGRLTVGDYTARAFQFRAQLRSGNPTYNIEIDQLRVKAEAL